MCILPSIWNITFFVFIFFKFKLLVGFKKFLVFATRLDLRVVSLDVRNKVDLILPVNVYKRMKAVDYDPVDKMIYWTDELEYGVILRTPVNGTSSYLSLFIYLYTEP